MTKHAINAFLATSVAFINEIAALCERVGADAKEVERGLKTEARIGPRAYLSPGGAFAGGTLARDVAFLRELGPRIAGRRRSIDGVEPAMPRTARGRERRLAHELGSVAGRRIAVWGLTYKPGTDTLRRSSAVELCRWLVRAGRTCCASTIRRCRTLAGRPRRRRACGRRPSTRPRARDALVVATEWPVYRDDRRGPARRASCRPGSCSTPTAFWARCSATILASGSSPSDGRVDADTS